MNAGISSIKNGAHELWEHTDMIKRTRAKSGGDRAIVSFSLPLSEAPDGASVLGDFNEWNAHAHPLRRRSNGTRSVKTELDPGIHHFKYLLDGGRWENEPMADRHYANEWGEIDSVLEI